MRFTIISTIEKNTRKLILTKENREKQAGFTLVELLVVMVILVLLASLVAPRVIGYLGSSKIKTAKIQIESLSTSLELFRLDAGRYPTTQEGLAALITQPGNIPAWNGPYLKKKQVPNDPWGNAYIYKQPGDKAEFNIISYGADGKSGGNNENSDISSGI